MADDQTMELYKKHRPKKLEDVVGVPETIKILSKMIEQDKIPHCLLFTGPSGCGKTTLARIIAKKLGCGKHDFSEVNCADFRGIDTIRDIRSRMSQCPISGSVRVWIIDEAHKLSNDAQNAFLKMLEDTPSHVYFMLATTDPEKLLKTVRTRCSEVAVKSLKPTEMKKLLKTTVEKEKASISEEVIDKIGEASEGSARKALVLLNQVLHLDDEEEMIEVVKSSTMEKQALSIARVLFNPSAKWAEVATVIKESDIEDPEQIRYMVLGYARNVLLGGGKMSDRAYLIINAFRDNFYDSKKAGLVAACYEVIVLK